mmetsp:Transcript_37240/g.119999  ORF Transcript_37240/g.119999 Transcript_37240/m.119999 type:complete len:425 (-) Transcript_37240:3035-4309(-)
MPYSDNTKMPSMSLSAPIRASSKGTKFGSVTLTVLTSLTKATVTSPIHHGRWSTSAEHSTTRVSTSLWIWEKRAFKLRKSSESTNTFRRTRLCSTKWIFSKRARFPALALWWEMKNSNGLPLRKHRSYTGLAIKLMKPSTAQPRTITAKMPTLRVSTPSTNKPPTASTIKKQYVKNNSNRLASRQRHGKSRALPTNEPSMTAIIVHHCAATPGRIGTNAITKFLVVNTKTNQWHDNRNRLKRKQYRCKKSVSPCLNFVGSRNTACDATAMNPKGIRQPTKLNPTIPAWSALNLLFQHTTESSLRMVRKPFGCSRHCKGATMPETMDNSSAMKSNPVLANNVVARAFRSPWCLQSATTHWMTISRTNKPMTANSRVAKRTTEDIAATHSTGRMLMSRARIASQANMSDKGEGQDTSIKVSTPSSW